MVSEDIKSHQNYTHTHTTQICIQLKCLMALPKEAGPICASVGVFEAKCRICEDGLKFVPLGMED